MKRKNGITLSALVLYITLLFTFVAIATAVAKRFELNAFEQKALGVNMENYSRLSASFNVSANESDVVELDGTTLTFLNGGVLVDRYTFDTEKGHIYKNGVLVVSDVNSFNITKDGTSLTINVQFMKYSVMTEREIFIHV